MSSVQIKGYKQGDLSATVVWERGEGFVVTVHNPSEGGPRRKSYADEKTATAAAKRFIKTRTLDEDEAAAGPAITTSSMGPGALYAPKVMGTVSRFREFDTDRFDQSFMKKMRKKLNEDAAESSEFDSITVGSRVTILTPQKQERSGRAVMRNREQDLWVLNMGGPHGRPGIADRRNFVKVTGNKKKMRVENESIEAEDGKNGYVGFYKGKRFEVHADTTYEAQKKIAAQNKIKDSYNITVKLAEKDGRPVVHLPLESAISEGKVRKVNTFFDGKYLHSSMTDKSIKKLKADLLADLAADKQLSDQTFTHEGHREKLQLMKKHIVNFPELLTFEIEKSN